jgi:aspartyl-tRNA(Asn)/glutamyl-tRNA(Gln) amidotransferase subunit A
MDPCDLPSRSIGNLYASGKLSPREVVESVLRRIGDADGLLGGMWMVDGDRARREAAAAEVRWRDKKPFGPLDGVPVTIKELIATEGVARPMGTAAGDMTPQARDAPPAARLREAGAIIIGKTTTPDFGMLSSGLSSFHRLARNPWDVALSPGGSSAGAGTAAAAGYGPLHLGTDIGGSVRLPAGWCGLFALKPSFGRVPIDPPYIGRVAGPMTRTVEDAALMMPVIAQPDERDYMSLPPAEIAWLDHEIDLRGLRIALQMDAGCGMPVAPDTALAVEAAARTLGAAGAVIEPIAPFLTAEMLNGLDRFWRTRFLAETRAYPPGRYALVLPYIRQWVEAARAYDGLDAYTGFDQIIRMQEAGLKAMRGFDFLISPTAPDAAFPAEWASPLNDPDRPFEHIAFTVASNMTEQPSASINCGYTSEGLPIGLQIVGRRFDDLGVLKLARAYERLRPEQRPWPTPWLNKAKPA